MKYCLGEKRGWIKKKKTDVCNMRKQDEEKDQSEKEQLQMH